MGFKGSRGPLLLIAIAVIAVIGIAAVVMQPPPTSTANPLNNKQVTVTVNKAIGIDYVVINNLDANTGDFKVSYIQLPYSFNCTPGDTLVFTGVTQKGYLWNGWEFNTGHPITDNPLTVTSDDTDYVIKGTMNITPNCFRINPTPTPIPTPSPIPTVSPTPSWGSAK